MDATPASEMTDPGPMILPDNGFGVPDEASALFKAELEPGERLLWVGQSNSRGVLEETGCIFAFPWFVCFFLCSLSCFSVIPSYLSRRSVDSAEIIGLVCGIIALVILLGVILQLIKRLRAKVTHYALTDRRAIIRAPATIRKGAVEVHSIWRGQVGRLHRVEYPDGSGDVVFHLGQPHAYPDLDGFLPAKFEFEKVPDVRRVEDLARRVLLAPKTDIS